MSKRYMFPQQYGERKKAKLDVTVSDHNFPLSQNLGNGKDGNHGNSWGDDNDDEILLLASQACEEAYNDHNISDLPNYSVCMQPETTSTQFCDPAPSTSKTAFTFKKPTSSPINIITTKLKDKCDRISSPLPGMSKVCKMNGVNVSDDIIINDNIGKQDTDHIYRQLLKLKEENGKLKLENGKLLEKCVTKEGEASILRTQLKASQISVDSARLEKVKVQERMQMEWSDKVTAVSNQMHDLRTQLDFKNLEIISIKEKCKMLESNKVRLTQITVTGNDVTMSQRHNNNSYAGHQAVTQYKKLKTASSAVQTDEKSHFVQLNIPAREGISKLPQILPLILTPTNNQCSILDFNEKLRQSREANKCRIYSTFHRLPSTPKVCKEKRKKMNLNTIYESLSKMAACRDWTVEDFLDVFKIAIEVLQDVQCELEMISQRMTTAFQKEMDEKYIDVTSNLLVVYKKDLLTGRALYKEEQVISARRMTAVLVYILEDSRCEQIVENILYEHSMGETDLLNSLNKICTLLDNTTCALLYSGLLFAITLLLKRIVSLTTKQKQIIEILKTVILSRPMPFVTCEILHLFGQMLSAKTSKELCCKGVVGNLKMDYDQGVLLYRKDSCILQVMLKQIEGVLNISYKDTGSQQEKHRCDCQIVLMQVIVYGLNVCANMLNTGKLTDTQTDILGRMSQWCTDIYSSMLSEITSTFQAASEDQPTHYHRQAWLSSFQNCTMTD
ncbi:jg21588 [Pararge aegeria aegeria]|uniref:Jg21588 protein n=2 Tax=Pararge aegeria TaxID=116150 RepID=A0A8S4SCW6_9NEOP|nr:jg21588 [Pararge aegeria aegeria]